MKTNKLWLGLAATVSILGSGILPVAAQPVPAPETQQPPMPYSQQAAPQVATIPQSTAIVVSFPSAVVVDVGQEQDYPLTLPLAQAIYDSYGNVVVPENTPISILLKPVDDGAQVVAESMVVRGQIIPIQAASPTIPGTTITHMRANDRAVENGAVWGRILGSGFGFMNSGDPDQFDRGAMLGSAIGLLSGLRSPENTRVVQIPQGSVYILTLQAPITLGVAMN